MENRHPLNNPIFSLTLRAHCVSGTKVGIQALYYIKFWSSASVVSLARMKYEPGPCRLPSYALLLPACLSADRLTLADRAPMVMVIVMDSGQSMTTPVRQ